VLRAVGWLARFDLRSRPVPAGPMMPVDGAQCPGPVESRLFLCADGDGAAATDAELGFRGVLGGPEPMLAPGVSLLALEPRDLILSACKPAGCGDGLIVRVLNVTDAPRTAVLRVGFPVREVAAVRLDETPADHPVTRSDDGIRFDVPPRGLRSILLT
jgi:mannosylglycerate hydrolase